MLHSAPISGKSLSTLSIVLAALIAASPALAAKKKKAADHDDEPAPAAAASSDSKLVAPAPDTFGRVHFGPSSGANLGRISVKAAESDKVQVFVEGRYFGLAPITIYSVPKGDYIVEGTFGDGKTASRPVSVLENEEAVADLTGAHPAVAETKAPLFVTTEISPNRLLATKAFIVVGAAALVFGVVMGILESRKESEYHDAPADATPGQLDSIRNSGKTYALLANVGFALTFVGVAGAAICAYPMFVKPTVEKKMASRPVFMLVPGASSVNAGMAMRF